MLPFEKCLELKNNGYSQEQPNHWYNRDGGYECRDFEESDYSPCFVLVEGDVACPSGDELLAECVKLLSPNEWISRETTSAGSCTCVIAIVEEVDEETGEKYDGQYHVYCGGQESCEKNHELFRHNNSDLADAWLWLNERKKVRE